MRKRVTLADALRRYGLNQQDIVDRSGLSAAWVSYIVNGQRRPGNAAVAAIATAVGRTPKWVLERFADTVHARQSREQADLLG